MRKNLFMGRTFVMIGFMVAALSAPVSAQDNSKPADVSPIQVSQNVADVLKLTRSQIAEDTLVAFVNNSSASYTLGASELIYLKEQGVSDRVITAMLNHRSQTSASNVPANPPPTTSVWADSVPATRTVVTTAPAYVPPRTVYVAPPPAYNYYPSYYYPRYGYGYPYYSPLSISLGFGFGFGGHHHGGFHGRHR